MSPAAVSKPRSLSTNETSKVTSQRKSEPYLPWQSAHSRELGTQQLEPGGDDEDVAWMFETSSSLTHVKW